MDSQIRALTISVFVLTGWLGPTLGMSQESDQVRTVIEQVRADCAEFEDGALDVKPGAVSQVELTGDDRPEEIVDSRFLSCSSAASLYCGTGGCSIWVLAEGTTRNLLVKDWQVVDHFGTPVLLSNIHGSECGGDNTRRCARAYVWSQGSLQTVD
ncbi:MAG: hypothetical protein AAGC81_15390 [Pseudomonadota bacterium]